MGGFEPSFPSKLHISPLDLKVNWCARREKVKMLTIKETMCKWWRIKPKKEKEKDDNSTTNCKYRNRRPED